MAELEPVGPDFYDTARWTIDTVRELAVPRADVWRMISDNSAWEQWFPNVTECRTTSEQPSGLGSTRRIRGRGLDVTERFIVWEDEAVWGFTILTMKFGFATRMAERATLTDLGGGRTRVVYRLAADPRPWVRWMRPLIAAGARRAIGGALENIERIHTGRPRPD